MQKTNNCITLITTNALGFPLLIRHKAIKFTGEDNKEMILHRTTSGVEIISYTDFMKERHIINHRAYPVRRTFDAVQLMQKGNETTFNWMSNNCEDFTSEVIEQTTGVRMRPRSPQRTKWMIVLGLILLVMILVKK